MNPPINQYTPEERNFMMMAYQNHRGKASCIMKVQEKFRDKFPNSRVPPQKTINQIWKKQNTAFTVHNLNSKTSPGDSHSGRKRSAITPESIQAVQDMLDRDCEKENDDPNIHSCRRNELGLSAATMSRIINHHLNYHCYKYVNYLTPSKTH